MLKQRPCDTSHMNSVPMFKIILPLFIFSHLLVFGESNSILEERDWTSKDGRVIEATLVKVEDANITLKMSKDNKIHTLEVEKLSGKDRLLVSDSQDKASKVVEDHNSKVKNLSWYSDWHFRNSYSGVPELEIDELRLIYYFGKARDLGIFAVKAKAAAGWSFMESDKDLKVRSKSTSSRTSDRVEVVYANGVSVRLLFANGRSISEGEIGIEKCLILALENFEPRFAR